MRLFTLTTGKIKIKPPWCCSSTRMQCLICKWSQCVGVQIKSDNNNIIKIELNMARTSKSSHVDTNIQDDPWKAAAEWRANNKQSTWQTKEQWIQCMHICRQGLKGDKRNHRQVIVCRNHMWNIMAVLKATSVPQNIFYLYLDKDSPIYYLSVHKWYILLYIHLGAITPCIDILLWSDSQNVEEYWLFMAVSFCFIIIWVTLCRASQQQTILIRSY